MEKNSNVLDNVIEQVEKSEKLKEKVLKKVRQDKEIRQYLSDLFSLFVGFVFFLLMLEIPNVVGYFYIDKLNPLDVVIEVLYVMFLVVVLVRNYVTLRKINSNQ